MPIGDDTSDKIRLGILIGVALLIAIAGFNAYETRRQRIEMSDQMAQLAKAINTRPATNPAQPPRPGGPDPEKIYTIKTDTAPVEGSRSAPVMIVEISDFQ